MAVVREADLTATLKRDSATLRGALVFGGDDIRVNGISSQIVQALAAQEDVTRLQASVLRSDPALLDDALRAQSLLGGRQLVWLDDVSDVHAKILEPVVRSIVAVNFLVVSAGSLGKSSALRGLFEGAEGFFAVAVYDDRPGDILNLVTTHLKRSGLEMSEEASDRFMALCGTDRQLALNEAEKLSLFAHGQSQVSAEEVMACCGDQASYGLDELIDAVMAGDSVAGDRMGQSLDDSELRSVLPILAAHVARLSALRSEADRLGGIDAALRAGKPPVFFARKQSMTLQLRAFDSEKLLRVQVAVERAVEESRRFPALAREIVGRLCFSLGSEARRGLRT